HRLVRRKLAHADALGFVGRHAERHPLLLEPEHIELQLHAGDFLFQQLNHTADAVLGVYNVITDVEGQRLGSHVTSTFHWEAPLITQQRREWRRTWAVMMRVSPHERLMEGLSSCRI